MEEKLKLLDKMKNTYLIQRLRDPLNSPLANLFSFGGGLKNGGLSDDAMNLLKEIFSFDYMGSSEFEWGAVPNALYFIAEQASKNNIICNKINIKNNDIFYLCPKNYEEEVKDRITKLYIDEYKNFRLKEPCNLKDVFESKYDFMKKTKGWIELNNGFMFFVDKEMFQKTTTLFGVNLKDEI